MISLPNVPKVVKKEGNKAIFEIDALYPGYGTTIGNSLRRVLLSSLEGAAVTQVKIKGVSHEFSTMQGVLEDVIMIILNLKQLSFKLFTDEPQKATLKAKGEKKVKASDVEVPSQAELLNKDCHIATLTSKSSELEMELLIEKGVGYSSSESRKKEKIEIGSISLDAFFSPVRKVSYKVENMRVGDRTDYNKLFLEIETDGAVSPEEAMWKASETLERHFSLIVSAFKEEEKEEVKIQENPKKSAPSKEKNKSAKKKTEKKKSSKDEKKKKGKKI